MRNILKIGDKITAEVIPEMRTDGEGSWYIQKYPAEITVTKLSIETQVYCDDLEEWDVFSCGDTKAVNLNGFNSKKYKVILWGMGVDRNGNEQDFDFCIDSETGVKCCGTRYVSIKI